VEVDIPELMERDKSVCQCAILGLHKDQTCAVCNLTDFK
jgi:hypothetical protein